MSAMQINGLGLVGGFGCGRDDLQRALLQGSAPLSQVELRGHQFPLLQAETASLETYLNKRGLRRIDHFSRLALLGAFEAMADADLGGVDPNRIGLVIGSGYGALTTTFKFLDSVLDDGDTCASPTAFSNLSRGILNCSHLASKGLEFANLPFDVVISDIKFSFKCAIIF